MRNIICVLLLFFFLPQLSGQSLSGNHATTLALSGTDICYSGGWYGYNNPSLLVQGEGASIGYSYYNRYLIPTLGSHSVYGTFSFFGSWGCSVNHFGTKAFNESSFTVSYGRKIFHWLDAGITMRSQHMAVEAIGGESFTVAGDIGILIKPSERIAAGIHLVNPNRSGFGNSGQDHLPAELNVGLAWTEKEDFHLAVQLHWQDYSDISLSLGAEYWLLKSLALRAGLKAGATKGYSYGLAYTLHKLTFSLGFEQHTCLGMSSAITLHYKFSAHEN